MAVAMNMTPLSGSPEEQPFSQEKSRLILVTGLSGAGLSTTLKALEDLGYEAIDNLPLRFVEPLIDQGNLLARPMAVGIDTRTRGFSANELAAIYQRLSQRPDCQPQLLFIDSSEDILQRRFTETRRRHPLAIDRPVVDGIRHERSLLMSVRNIADLTIDTSDLTGHDLRRLIFGHFPIGLAALQVFVMSFSFRRGIPREADLVFDVRFLRNPHYDDSLRHMTGQDQPVQDYIAGDADFVDFEQNLQRLLSPLLPRYQNEGKSYLTIAIGCTGGRHRSVFLAERITAWLRQRDLRIRLVHRELDLPVAG